MAWERGECYVLSEASTLKLGGGGERRQYLLGPPWRMSLPASLSPRAPPVGMDHLGLIEGLWKTLRLIQARCDKGCPLGIGE